MSERLKILIVEDNPIIAADLESLLDSKGFSVVAVAHNALDAFDLLANRILDFAILDIHLGHGQSGIDIAEVIHDKYQLPYIFLTSFDDDNTIIEAQKHAPFGYLVKPFQERTVISTIKTAMANHRYLTQGQSTDMAKIRKLAHTPLTEQECTVIKYLLKGDSYKQIAAQNFISVNTVKFHAKNVYLKLAIKGRIELVGLVR